MTVPEGDMVVTGTRLRRHEDDGSGGGGLHYYAAHSPSPLIDLFAQQGGGETAQVVQFDWNGLDLRVRLPGISTVIFLPASDRLGMTSEQFADFVKIMTEFRDDPLMVAALQRMSALGLAELPVRFDDVIHLPGGGTENWEGAGHYERMAMTFNQWSDGRITDFKAVLNINSTNVPGFDGVHNTMTNTQGETVNIDFAHMILHAIRHAFYAGQPNMEDQVKEDTDVMYDHIYLTLLDQLKLVLWSI